jgi:hypothetical protein
LQLPGEALLLPAYWHHQTLNVGESVAVGGQHNNLRWQDPAEAVRQLRAQQSMNAVPNPRLLEALSDAVLHTSKAAGSKAAGRGGKETGAAVKASLRYLLKAVAVEPLNGRLALRAARQAHALGRQRLVVQLLRDAVTTLAGLEAADWVGAADAAERGGQLGVALATLAKEESATALPLLWRSWTRTPIWYLALSQWSSSIRWRTRMGGAGSAPRRCGFCVACCVWNQGTRMRARYWG